MKKSFKIISAAILSATMAMGLGVTIFATTSKKVEEVHADVGIYYSSITDSMSGTTLLNALNTLNNQKRTSTVSYDGMKTFSAVCDADPDGSGKIIGFYDNAKLGPSWDSAATWNREHVWPNARGGSKVEKDAHMVRPASVKTNSGRGSKGFGEDSFDPGSIVAYYRGVASRIIFYCAIADTSLKIEDIVLNSDGSSPANTMGTLSDMLRWNLQYLPTDTSFTGANDLARRTELSRNEKIQTASGGQGNRNPFIDHPEYACKIWGNTNSTTQQICSGNVSTDNVSISVSSKTMAVDATDTISATSSDGSTISWTSSNTSVVTVSNATSASGTNITLTAKAAGTSTITAKATINNVQYSATCTVTVTASGTIVEGDSETIDFTTQGYTDQQTVSSVTGTNCTATLAKGSNNNAPKYFSNGDSVRCYGGNTITISSSSKTIVKIEFTFGSSDGSNAITANTGSYSSGTWTGSASSVTFTVGGTSGNRRITQIKVTYQGSGGGSTTPTVTGVTLNKSTLSLDLNGTKTSTLTVTVTGTNSPAQTVNWSSSNTSVATVSGGTVTAKAVGTATITATSTVDSSKKGTCTVTVTDSSVSSEKTYQVVTSTSGLSAGDKVVIVGSNSGSYYYMKNEVKSSTLPWYLVGESITPSNNQISGDNLTEWTVSKSGNYFSFTNNNIDLYGYVNSTHYSLNLGPTYTMNSTTTNVVNSYSGVKTWTYTITNSSTGAATLYANSSANVYLEYYKGSFCGFNQVPGSSNSIFLFKEVTTTTNPAKEYAQNFLAAFTCDATGTNAPTFASDKSWASLKTAFNALGTTDQNTLKNATANESGTDIEKAVARYDYVVAKYNYENFMSRTKISLTNRMMPISGTSTNSILLILGSISLLGGLTYLAYFLKKRKED